MCVDGNIRLLGCNRQRQRKPSQHEFQLNDRLTHGESYVNGNTLLKC